MNMDTTKICRVKIIHEKFGLICDETFLNPTQFKLFLKSIDGCLNGENHLRFFNGEDFLINIPNVVLKNCIVSTSVIAKLTDGEIILENLRSGLEQKV